MNLTNMLIHVDDYATVREAVEAFREFVSSVRDGADHDVMEINAMALFAARAESALDHAWSPERAPQGVADAVA